jgi:hypothetical protein
MELDEDEVRAWSEDDRWVAALPQPHRRNVELLVWNTARGHQPGALADRRLRRLRAFGVVPNDLMRVLGALPLVVEAVELDHVDDTVWWVDFFARWEDDDARGND